MRQIATVITALFFHWSIAQTPNLVIRADLRPTLITSSSNATAFRFYDILGRVSTVGLSLILEPGFRVLINERLQRIGGDGDLLDEAYIEDPGTWRVGKQYLPFGARNIVRDNAMAIRLDSGLSVGFLHAIAAYCDGGPGETRGLVARVGTRIGFSVAVGRHFTINGTSLAQIRDPERAAGKGRGYRLLLGFDYAKPIGELMLELEFVSLSQGETVLDLSEDVTDLKVTYPLPGTTFKLVGAWSRQWQARRDYYRFEAELPATGNLTIIPFVRLAALSWKDLGISARFKF